MSKLPPRQSHSPHQLQVITVRGSNPRHNTAETLLRPRSPRPFCLHNMAGLNRRTIHQCVISMGTSPVPSFNMVALVTKPKRPTRRDLSSRPILVTGIPAWMVRCHTTHIFCGRRLTRRPGGVLSSQFTRWSQLQSTVGRASQELPPPSAVDVQGPGVKELAIT